MSSPLGLPNINKNKITMRRKRKSMTKVTFFMRDKRVVTWNPTDLHSSTINGRRKMQRYIENLDSPMINHSTDVQIIVIKWKTEIGQDQCIDCKVAKTVKVRYTLAIKQIWAIGYKKIIFTLLLKNTEWFGRPIVKNCNYLALRSQSKIKAK